MNEYLKPAKTRTWNPLIHSLRLVNKSFYALVIEKKNDFSLLFGKHLFKSRMQKRHFGFGRRHACCILNDLE